MGVPSFTRLTDGVDDVLASHHNDAYDAIEAIAKASGVADYATLTTMSGTVTLTDTDSPVQSFDPNGSDRIVYLPTPSTDNHAFFFRNRGSAIVSIRDNSTDSNIIVAPTLYKGALVVSDANGWRLALGGGSRITSEASSATPTINTNNTDIHRITALAAAITSFTTNLSGTPTHGQKLIIEILDDATARAITWGASFRSTTQSPLPTTTTISKLLRCGFMYDSVDSIWDCVAVVEEA